MVDQRPDSFTIPKLVIPGKLVFDESIPTIRLSMGDKQLYYGKKDTTPDCLYFRGKNQVSGESSGSVALSQIVHRVVRERYVELEEILEIVQKQTNSEKKRSLIHYFNKSKTVFSGLLALCKWTWNSTGIHSALNVIHELGNLDNLYKLAADELVQIHWEQFRVSIPSFDIVSAMDLCGVGTLDRIPKAVGAVCNGGLTEQIPQMFGFIESKIIRKLLDVDRVRVKQLDFGTVSLAIDKFQLVLTLNSTAEWRVLKFDPLFSVDHSMWKEISNHFSTRYFGLVARIQTILSKDGFLGLEPWLKQLYFLIRGSTLCEEAIRALKLNHPQSAWRKHFSVEFLPSLKLQMVFWKSKTPFHLDVAFDHGQTVASSDLFNIEPIFSDPSTRFSDVFVHCLWSLISYKQSLLETHAQHVPIDYIGEHVQLDRRDTLLRVGFLDMEIGSVSVDGFTGEYRLDLFQSRSVSKTESVEVAWIGLAEEIIGALKRRLSRLYLCMGWNVDTLPGFMVSNLFGTDLAHKLFLTTYPVQEHILSIDFGRNFEASLFQVELSKRRNHDIFLPFQGIVWVTDVGQIRLVENKKFIETEQLAQICLGIFEHSTQMLMSRIQGIQHPIPMKLENDRKIYRLALDGNIIEILDIVIPMVTRECLGRFDAKFWVHLTKDVHMDALPFVVLSSAKLKNCLGEHNMTIEEGKFVIEKPVSSCMVQQVMDYFHVLDTYRIFNHQFEMHSRIDPSFDHQVVLVDNYPKFSIRFQKFSFFVSIVCGPSCLSKLEFEGDDPIFGLIRPMLENLMHKERNILLFLTVLDALDWICRQIMEQVGAETALEQDYVVIGGTKYRLKISLISDSYEILLEPNFPGSTGIERYAIHEWTTIKDNGILINPLLLTVSSRETLLFETIGIHLQSLDLWAQFLTVAGEMGNSKMNGREIQICVQPWTISVSWTGNCTQFDFGWIFDIQLAQDSGSLTREEADTLLQLFNSKQDQRGFERHLWVLRILKLWRVPCAVLKDFCRLLLDGQRPSPKNSASVNLILDDHSFEVDLVQDHLAFKIKLHLQNRYVMIHFVYRWKDKQLAVYNQDAPADSKIDELLRALAAKPELSASPSILYISIIMLAKRLYLEIMKRKNQTGA